MSGFSFRIACKSSSGLCFSNCSHLASAMILPQKWRRMVWEVFRLRASSADGQVNNVQISLDLTPNIADT